MEPSALACGHTYCWACACELIDAGTDDEPAACLVCLGPISDAKQDLAEDGGMAAIIAELNANDPIGNSLPEVEPLEGVEVMGKLLGAGSFGQGMYAPGIGFLMPWQVIGSIGVTDSCCPPRISPQYGKACIEVTL